MDIEAFQKTLNDFTQERDWEKFHTPKNLVMALTGEAGELTELFQWVSESESFHLTDDRKIRQELEDEMADIMIYLLRLADVLDVDIEKACYHKIEKNRRKYPAHLVKGSAKKYTEYEIKN